jgi:hypothetical protein
MKPLLKDSLVLLGCYVLLLGSAWYAYATAAQFSGVRTNCLVALIVAPLAAAACLAGMIHLLDRPLTPSPAETPAVPWYLRFTLEELKRVLLALQILTTAVAVGAVLALVFQFPIPSR